MIPEEYKSPKTAQIGKAIEITNEVDSEKILTSLTHNGYNINKDHRNADLVIINTCGFIDSAKEESINTISSSLNENGKWRWFGTQFTIRPN